MLILILSVFRANMYNRAFDDTMKGIESAFEASMTKAWSNVGKTRRKRGGKFEILDLVPEPQSSSAVPQPDLQAGPSAPVFGRIQMPWENPLSGAGLNVPHYPNSEASSVSVCVLNNKVSYLYF